MKTPTHTEAAIMKTVLYGDVFDFPMTSAEIHHFLIGSDASLENVQQTLQSSPWLAERLIRVNGYYALRAEAAEVRHRRADASEQLWDEARKYGIWLANLPFVRMVALTGALAVKNAEDEADDFDYLIVTEPGRVWLTRLMAVMVVRLARLWGVQLCPNYVLSAATLEQNLQNIYIAHELAQMIPISGYQLYCDMRAVNAWSYGMMPNAMLPFYNTPEYTPRRWTRWLKGFGEWVLGGRVGNWLEHMEQRRKTRKFGELASPAAEIDEERVKGHFNDYGQAILHAFRSRLRDHHLDEH